MALTGEFLGDARARASTHMFVHILSNRFYKLLLCITNKGLLRCRNNAREGHWHTPQRLLAPSNDPQHEGSGRLRGLALARAPV